jgi:hypothetical protein
MLSCWATPYAVALVVPSVKRKDGNISLWKQLAAKEKQLLVMHEQSKCTN